MFILLNRRESDGGAESLLLKINSLQSQEQQSQDVYLSPDYHSHDHWLRLKESHDKQLEVFKGQFKGTTNIK